VSLQRFAVRTLPGCLAALVSVVVVVGLPPASAKIQGVTSAEQQLAEKYAPIAMLRAQEKPCDKDGEGYFPSPVDFIFHNPDFKLRANAGGDADDDPVLLDGFTPQDLAIAGPETYLDFPGKPREPGCDYETYFKDQVADRGFEPTTYVRFVVDEAKRRLYVEYWFWYYLKD
jgi:hypothetical protein